MTVDSVVLAGAANEEEEAIAFECIVTGVDGTHTSRRALAVAIDVAKRYQGVVHACFVWPLTATELRAGLSAAPLFAAEVRGDEGQLGRTVDEELRRAGVEGDFSQREGEIAQELEALASSCNAGLIVVGRSHHAVLHLGGVPRALLAVSGRPVLVVP